MILPLPRLNNFSRNGIETFVLRIANDALPDSVAMLIILVIPTTKNTKNEDSLVGSSGVGVLATPTRANAIAKVTGVEISAI